MVMLPRIFAPVPITTLSADGRMPLAFLLAGSAQRHALIQQHVVADFGGFADHDAHAVVDEAASSDVRARMDLDAGHGPVELRNDARQQRETADVQPVRQPVQQDGMKAGVTEKNLDRALGGWIAAENGIDLFPDGSKHSCFGLIIALGRWMQGSELRAMQAILLDLRRKHLVEGGLVGGYRSSPGR